LLDAGHRAVDSRQRVCRGARDPVDVAERANDLLAPVYAWFTEGFATKDLKDAKALLQELETLGTAAPAAPA